MEAEYTNISKFLSLILPHDPGRIGIVLDENGWADVQTLIEKAAAHGLHIKRQILADAVETNPKRRFSLSANGEKIRAVQGQSM